MTIGGDSSGSGGRVMDPAVDGVSDGRRSVQVWTDPQNHQIIRVRVSNRWRERLGRRSLASAVEAAFTRAQAVAGAPEVDLPTRAEPGRKLPPRKAGPLPGLGDLFALSAELDEKERELESRDPSEIRGRRTVGEPTVSQAAQGRIRLVFSPELAQVASVEIDQDWATRSRAAELIEALETALAEGYRTWRPCEQEPGERDVLAAQRMQLRDRILALLNGREYVEPTATAGSDPRRATGDDESLPRASFGIGAARTTQDQYGWGQA